jgi:hypothetical protein
LQATVSELDPCLAAGSLSSSVHGLLGEIGTQVVVAHRLQLGVGVAGRIGHHVGERQAFTLHARALTAFLYPTAGARREGDVVSDQYVVDVSRWAEARGDIPDILLTVMRRTAKEIAHLTTDRLEYDDPGKEWPLLPILDALRGALKRFVQHAPRARLAEYVARYVGGLQSPMEQARVVIHNAASTAISTVSGPFLVERFPTDIRTRRAGEPR